MRGHSLFDDPLTIPVIAEFLRGGVRVSLSQHAKERISRCRSYLEEKVRQSRTPLYGINTGFGSLYTQHISPDQLGTLQENLVKSHACGTGPDVPIEIVRLMLLLKIQSLAYGYSGVQLSTVERLVDMLNHNVVPRVFEMGSLGASGDLAPLAHLTLPLLNEGEVWYGSAHVPSASVASRLGWTPIRLGAKEGLALLNGTQFMSAYGVWACYHAHRLTEIASLVGALSLDTFDGRLDPFDDDVHAIRPHPGQRRIARRIRELLAGSELIAQPKRHVQDPYSFRCIPQVHGASADAIDYATRTFLVEINSVTDNPNIFPDLDKVISAGNFHGQPLAIALDLLAIALSELGSIAERRTYQLIGGLRHLPAYLVANPGINSGLMIPQYTSASLVSQNKQLCTPSSVDSIVSSNGQEDHVSMGANAATKVYRVVQNVYSILAIELLTASQALTFRRPLRTSAVLEDFVHNFRGHVPFIEDDRVLHQDIQKAELFLKSQEAFHDA